MTKGEAEELLLKAVMSDRDVIMFRMKKDEASVFRVLAGRIIKEMESKNRALWMKARVYGIEWREPYAVVRRTNSTQYEMFTLGSHGEVTSFELTPSDSAMSIFDAPAREGEDNAQ
jgi:hypothetical protein